MNLGLGFGAFVAGLFSFATPCVLPLVPVWVGYLVGATPNDAARRRSVALRQALAFVAGFTLVFVALWASVGLVGYLLRDHVGLLRQLGGAVLVVMGLHVAGLVDIPLMWRQFTLPTGRLTGMTPTGVRTDRGPSLGRSVLFGVAFAAGWTPCVGPILGSIIGVASMRETVGQGTLLLLAYALGLAVPFVLVAVGANAVSARLSWFRRHERAVSLFTGAMLVAVGFLMITNLFAKISGLFPVGL